MYPARRNAPPQVQNNCINIHKNTGNYVGIFTSRSAKFLMGRVLKSPYMEGVLLSLWQFSVLWRNPRKGTSVFTLPALGPNAEDGPVRATQWGSYKVSCDHITSIGLWCTFIPCLKTCFGHYPPSHILIAKQYFISSVGLFLDPPVFTFLLWAHCIMLHSISIILLI